VTLSEILTNVLSIYKMTIQSYTYVTSGVARGGGLGGSNPPHCEKMCIFYCLVFEQKQWLSLYFFSSVRNSLGDDVNVHSGIKETRVCDCVTINYRDAAYISTYCRVLYTHCNV